MNMLIILAWIAFAAILLIYVYHAYTILRQKETVLRDKQAIYRFLSNRRYPDAMSLAIVAGEANVEFYGDFCPLLRETFLKQGGASKVTFVIGPKLSTWSKNQPMIGANGLPLPNLSTEQLLAMHPILQLRHDFPDHVEIYLKQNNQYHHFALAGNALYVEEPHEPLKESKAIWIDNPNPWLQKKYAKKLQELVSSGNAVKIESDNDISSRIPFGYFVSDPR